MRHDHKSIFEKYFIFAWLSCFEILMKLFQLMTLVSDKAVIDLIDNPPHLPPRLRSRQELVLSMLESPINIMDMKCNGKCQTTSPLSLIQHSCQVSINFGASEGWHKVKGVKYTLFKKTHFCYYFV